MTKVCVDNAQYEIEAILFDKDGTLIELDALWSGWFDELWLQINQAKPFVKAGKQTIAQSIGLDIHNELISVKSPLAMGTMEDIAIILSYHLYGEGLAWDEAMKIVRQAMNTVHDAIDWKTSLQAIHRLEPFLKEAQAKGVKLAVVTSDDTDIAELHLQLLGLDHYFTSILGSENIARPKPFPDIGIASCHALDVPVENVIVIGDTNADMNLGKNLHAKATIGIVNELKGDGSHLIDADHLINHYGQLSIQ